MRLLSAEEQALWERVTATIRPLSREALEEPPKVQAQRLPAQPKTLPRQVARAPVVPPSTRPAPHAHATLDSSWDRRLRAGAIQPDRMLDLHGYSLDQAWSAIDRGIEQAVGSGERVILLVTGHARPGDPPVARGKIRAAVDDWLGASRHASKIAAVRGAHPRHGGGGSLYIILRRNRGKSTVS